MIERRWRMEKQCADCPFAKRGSGAFLRKTLGHGRMAGIKRELLSGGGFQCHKTTAETGDGSNRQCAGALEFQERHGVSNQLARIMERLDWLARR